MKSLVDKFEWIEWPQKNLPGVTPEDVLRIEKEIGFKIPLDYVEVSRHVHGKEPTPGSHVCLLYTSPSPRDKRQSRMPSSA